MVPTGLIVVAAIVAVLTFFMARGKKKMAIAKAQNSAQFEKLGEKAYADMPDLKQENIEIFNFMSDSNNYYIVCKDKTDNVLAFVSEKETVRMKLTSKKNCEILVDWVGNDSFEKVVCKITCKELTSPLEVLMVAKPHKKNSFVGKMVLDNAQLFKNAIMSQ